MREPMAFRGEPDLDPHTSIVGFYSILDIDDESLARLLVRPVDAGGAGARVLQVRIKPAEPVATSAVLAAAHMARRVTSEVGALLIVNDRIDIALAVGADGVHLGQDDLPIEAARTVLEHAGVSRRFLIGVSTHDPEQVARAVASGADYLGFGPVFETTTKARPDPVKGLAGLRRAVAAAGGVPVVAIGGITPATAAEVAANGASAACCVAAVNHAREPALEGARVTAAFAAVPR